MGKSTWRAMAIGAVMGLLVVGVVVALAVLGVLPRTPSTKGTAEGPVLVALVLPDENGLNTPRAIDVYTPTGSGMTVVSVSPTTAATSAGTSAQTLADVYAFGGGAGLAEAYASPAKAPQAPAWIVIGPEQWATLAGQKRITLNVPAPIDVFDGRTLYSYSQGPTETPAASIGKLLDGAGYLDAAGNRSVREQVGDAVARELASTGASIAATVRSNLDPQQLAAWFKMIGTPARQPGS